jgi:hypothetical protein
MIRRAAVLFKNITYFALLFFALCFYCAPLLMTWVPKIFPYNAFLSLPLYIFIFFFSLSGVVGKDNKVTRLLDRIRPIYLIIIFLSWYNVIVSAMIFSTKTWAYCIAVAIVLFIIIRLIIPGTKNRSILAASWLFYALTSFSIIISYFGRQNCEQFVMQKEVKAIVNFCDERSEVDFGKQVSKFLKNKMEFNILDYRQTRELTPAPDGKQLYLSSTGASKDNPTRIFGVSAGSNRVEEVSDTFGGANTIVFYKKENIVIAMKPYEHKIDFLDGSDLKLKNSISFQGKIKPLWAVVDEDRGKLYALFSRSRYQIAIIDIHQARIEKKYRVAGGAVNAAVFDRNTDKLFVITGFAPDGNLLIAFNVKTHKYEKRKLRSFGYGIASDAGRKLLFVSYMHKLFEKGTVEMIDMRKLKSKGLIRSDYGVREIDYDPSTKRLFLGNYLRGTLDVVNPFTGVNLGSYYVGRRIRRVRYSRITGNVYVPTCNGFFKVDVGR